MPYTLKKALLKPSERSFYHALKKATDDQWIICPQVRLGDIFIVPTALKGETKWFGRIAGMHVDFLLCEPETFRPVLGIELDGVSHRYPRNVERDTFKNQVFAVAKLPLLRVPVQINYEVNGLNERMDQALADIPRRSPTDQPEQDPLAPPCPKCGAVMVRRVAERGERRGKAFYGCPNYPLCKGIRDLA